MRLVKGIAKAAAALVVCGVLVVGGSNAYVILSTQGRVVPSPERASETLASTAGLPSADCILVLGAAVRPDGTPSPMLQERLDMGIMLYELGVAPKILMSGDNQSERETYDEVNNMKAYAVEMGVPSEDIFCDHAGLCTYDSAYRLYHVFGAKSAVVVTQRYHLYRAMFDADSFGVKVVGVPSDRVEYPVKLVYQVREIAARLSDLLKVATKQDATLLSEPVSLDQSGDVTSWKY